MHGQTVRGDLIRRKRKCVPREESLTHPAHFRPRVRQCVSTGILFMDLIINLEKW